MRARHAAAHLAGKRCECQVEYNRPSMRVPDGVNLFPDHAKKFPCYGIKNSLFVLLGNWAETLDKSWLFRLCRNLDL
jgi:hypothetical protein